MAEVFRRRAGEVLGVEPEWILCGNGSDDILTIVTRRWSGRGNCCVCLIRVTCFTKRSPNFKAPGRRGAFQARLVAARRDLPPTATSAAGFLGESEQSLGHHGFAGAGLGDWPIDCPARFLVDEAYVDFAETQLPRSGGEVRKNLVSRSLSKSYALAGCASATWWPSRI